MAAKRKKPAPKVAPKRAARPKAKIAKAKLAKGTSAKAKLPKAKVPKAKVLKAKTAKTSRATAKSASAKATNVKGRAKPKAAPQRAAVKIKKASSLPGKPAAAKTTVRTAAGRVTGRDPRSNEAAEETTGVGTPGAGSSRAAVTIEADGAPPTTGPAVAAGEAEQESSPPGLPVPIASFTI